MNYDVVIARYGEIGLKSSKVRARFERKLVKNIKAAIDCEVDRNQGRIYIFPKNYGECLENLNKVFISCGGNEICQPDCIKLINKIKPLGINYKFVQFENQFHNFELYPISESKIIIEEIYHYIMGEN